MFEGIILDKDDYRVDLSEVKTAEEAVKKVMTDIGITDGLPPFLRYTTNYTHEAVCLWIEEEWNKKGHIYITGYNNLMNLDSYVGLCLLKGLHRAKEWVCLGATPIQTPQDWYKIKHSVFITIVLN